MLARSWLLMRSALGAPLAPPPPQDGLRVTYHWIKGELEKEAKEQGKDLRWGRGVGWGGGRAQRQLGQKKGRSH